MKITDLIIDPRSLGNKLWLVDVTPAYEYQNNKRTDTVLGYRYAVALPEKGLDKINVRIDGDKLMDCLLYTSSPGLCVILILFPTIRIIWWEARASQRMI